MAHVEEETCEAISMVTETVSVEATDTTVTIGEEDRIAVIAVDSSISLETASAVSTMLTRTSVSFA